MDFKLLHLRNLAGLPNPPGVAFNASVSGRLLKTVLPGSVCYPSNPRYNVYECATVLSNWTSAAFHSADPASIHSPSWANNSCNPIYANGTSIAGDPLAGSRGCTIGRYPPYVVNATDAAHIQEALKFAKKWNLRFNIKNTGHSGGGRSTAFGSLSVWTHHIRGFQLHDSFLPSCVGANGTCGTNIEPRMAVTVGAGERDDEIFQAAAAHNVAVVGGTNKDVGIVGWATGGGHGWLTSEFGQGADNIIQAVVVTPAGDVVTANEYQNSDLFWAIRGGGGGTFGVIVEVTMKAYPMPQATTWTLQISNKKVNCSSCWYDLMAKVHAELPALKDGGFQGYYTLGGPPSYNTLSFFGLFFLYNKPNGTAEALIKPLIAQLQAANNTASYTSAIAWAPTWISVFNKFPIVEGTASGGGASASRLLSAHVLTQDPELLARTLEMIGPRADGPKAGISNPSLAGSLSVSASKVDNALNPVWRDTVVHLIVSEGWKDGLPYSQVRAALDEMTNVKGAALRRLAPDGGAYFNEADSFEPDWQRSFWGINYPRLRAIKKKYDPDSIQWCPRCVGSEDWFEQVDGKLCRSA